MDGSSSRRVILICEECGERMVLEGPLSVWRAGYTFFECECGERLTLADRLERRKFVDTGAVTNSAATDSPLRT